MTTEDDLRQPGWRDIYEAFYRAMPDMPEAESEQDTKERTAEVTSAHLRQLGFSPVTHADICAALNKAEDEEEQELVDLLNELALAQRALDEALDTRGPAH